MLRNPGYLKGHGLHQSLFCINKAELQRGGVCTLADWAGWAESALLQASEVLNLGDQFIEAQYIPTERKIRLLKREGEQLRFSTAPSETEMIY